MWHNTFDKIWQCCWQFCKSGQRHTFRAVNLNIQLLRPVLTRGLSYELLFDVLEK